jgi:hypothetical protein
MPRRRHARTSLTCCRSNHRGPSVIKACNCGFCLVKGSDFVESVALRLRRSRPSSVSGKARHAPSSVDLPYCNPVALPSAVKWQSLKHSLTTIRALQLRSLLRSHIGRHAHCARIDGHVPEAILCPSEPQAALPRSQQPTIWPYSLIAPATLFAVPQDSARRPFCECVRQRPILTAAARTATACAMRINALCRRTDDRSGRYTKRSISSPEDPFVAPDSVRPAVHRSRVGKPPSGRG